MTADPAEPRLRLAATLRALRTDAGLSTTQLAERLGWSQSKVSKTELGRTVPPPASVRDWARATGAGAKAQAELVQIAEDAAHQATEWRRELALGRRRVQQEIQRMEAAASLVRVFSHDVVPGLAQTRPYAEAMFRLGRRAGPPAEPDQDVISARLARQAALDDPAKRFELLMSETALWRLLISPEQMRHQLRRLAELADRDNVMVGVIRFNAAERVQQYHGFAILGDPQDDEEALVLAETVTRAITIRSADEVSAYEEHFAALRQAATEGEDLHALVREVITKYISG